MPLLCYHLVRSYLWNGTLLAFARLTLAVRRRQKRRRSIAEPKLEAVGSRARL